MLTKKDDILRDIRQELNVTAGDLNLEDFITEGNIVLAGYSFAGLAALQILALTLAYFHRSHLIDAEMRRIDLEDGYEQLDNGLIDQERGHGSRGNRKSKRTSELPPRNGVSGSKEQSEAQANPHRCACFDLPQPYAWL